MDMIWQNDERVDRARVVLPRPGDRLAQRRDMVDEYGLPPLQQINREEPAAARNERATIVWHEEQDSTCLTGGVVEGGGLRLRLIRPTDYGLVSRPVLTGPELAPQMHAS